MGYGGDAKVLPCYGERPLQVPRTATEFEYKLSGCEIYQCTRPPSASAYHDGLETVYQSVGGADTPYLVIETDLNAPPYYWQVSAICDVGYNGTGAKNARNETTATVVPCYGDRPLEEPKNKNYILDGCAGVACAAAVVLAV